MVSSGAEIQTENGYVRIHPAILELLAQRQLSGREFRCLLFLFRKTYGYQKKEDQISLSQWQAGTGIPRTRVGAVLDSLVEKKLIYRIDGGTKRPSTWGFNKHFETWQEEPSVTLEGDSINIESVTLEGYSSAAQSVTLEGDSSEPSVTLEGDKSVTLQGDNKRKKDIKSKEGAPAPLLPPVSASTPAPVPVDPPLSDEARKYGEFVRMLEQTFAITISPSLADFVAEWVNAVSETEWVYALGECKAHKRQFVPRYIASILRRVVAERMPVFQAAPAPAVISGLSVADLIGD